MNIEKIKAHIKEHKEKYITVGVTVVISAGITYIIMRRPRAVLDYVGADCPDTESTGLLSFISNKFIIGSRIENQIVTVVEREGRGHPGYRVRDLDTLVEYETQGLYASEINCSPMTVSKHLRGIYPDACGHHAERIPA